MPQNFAKNASSALQIQKQQQVPRRPDKSDRDSLGMTVKKAMAAYPSRIHSGQETAATISLLDAGALPLVGAFGGAFGPVDPIPDGVLEDLAIDFVVGLGERNALGANFDAI